MSLSVSPTASLSAADEHRADPQGDAYTRSLDHVQSARGLLPAGASRSLRQILADVHFRRGSFDEAAREFEALLVEEPDSRRVLVALAAVERRRGRVDRALAHHARILALPGPPDPGARLARAEIFAEREDHAATIAECRVLLSHPVPTAIAAEARFRLASSLVALAQAGSESDGGPLRAEALAELRSAVELRSDHASSRYLLASLLRRSGEFAAAQRELAEYRRLHRPPRPLDVAALASAEREFEIETLVALARLLFEAGRAKESHAFVLRALAIDDSSRMARAFQAFLFLRGGNDVEALALYDALIAEEPGDAEALWNAGRIRLRRGESERAGALLLKACETRGRFPEGWDLVARLAAEGVALSNRAEELATRAVKEAPSPAAYVRLAIVQNRGGRPDHARATVRAGLERYPGHPELIEGLTALGGSR